MEIEIEVRTLYGESNRVKICNDKTIQDLNLVLDQIQSFPPHFHLFLNGKRLSLSSLISSHHIQPGDFIVAIPFLKKHPIHTTPEKSNEPDSSSKIFNLVWSDMMQDIQSLEDLLNHVDEHHSSTPKRKRELMTGPTILNILTSSADHGILDKNNCHRIIQVLSLVNCLSDSIFEDCEPKCVILRDSEMVPSGENRSACMCAPWVKTTLKAFCFLNIFHACCQMQRIGTTWDCLNEAANQLNEYGLEVCISDVEQISAIFPKMVCFTDDEIESTRMGNTIFIIKQKDRVSNNSGTGLKERKLVSGSRIVNAMKNRESSFKSNFWRMIKSLRYKNGNYATMSVSLEDLLINVKKDGYIASVNSDNQEQRSTFATSNSPNRKKCQDTSPMLPIEMVQHLKNGIGSEGQIVHIEEISAKTAIYTEIPMELSENTKSVLKCMAINKLYSHQTESIRASLAGKNVIVATMTSSGKSLCYNLPVIEVLSKELLACAIYLFPTKALAQDQQRALLNMTEGFYPCLNIGVYDGDTSAEDRMWLRGNARMLITNPDMLHMSILPYHEQFRRILSNLRFVVIDEAHAYKGAFGCHTSLILRRLRRLCSHVYGSDPTFVFCTATSANPREHALELANLSTLELIQNAGSPSASKLFVLWNPSLCLRTVSNRNSNVADGISAVMKRSSPILDISRLFAEMVQHGLRCIAFCKSRKLCELVLCYAREILQETAPYLVRLVSSYRAGYIAHDRRRIESELFGGKLRGIAATNALELGIDVGHIDVTLHLGFPGSISSLWQQAGRSGRREKPSLSVYVAFEGPLDQYFMKYPEKLFNRPIECCHLNAQNPQVLEQHLVCAAFEQPLNLLYDEKYFGFGLKDAINSLKDRGYLSFDQSRESPIIMWNYIGHEKIPSRAISIRAIEAVRYKVIDKQRNEVLEEIEESRAFFEIYEGAVLNHQGRTYLVKDLDIPSKTAFCQEADLKYYTKTRDYTDIHVTGGNIAYPARILTNEFLKTSAQAQICKVTTTWFGFRRIWKGSNLVFDTVELSLPSYSYQSQAVWIRVPQSIKVSVEAQNVSFRGGLHAASHALANVAPLFIICNSSDVASECYNPYDTRYVPERILLYDPHPGGIGIATQIQLRFTELLTVALQLLTSCNCIGHTGCPNCIQTIACQEYNEVLHKEAAIVIIEGILHEEKTLFGDTNPF